MQNGSRRNAYEVSAVMPFGDDEDVIGAAVQRLASYLRELGLPFEILAVDEDSGDNSHAVLALLRAHVPELRVLHAPGRGRGFESGIARAQGRLLWLIDPHTAVQAVAGFTRAVEQIPDQVDGAIVRGRFAVVHRTRALEAASALRGTGAVYYRRLAKRLVARGLRIAIQHGGGVGASLPGGAAPARPARTRGFLGIRRIFGVEKNP